MQSPVKERIAKLRDEIAQISEANRLYLQLAGSHTAQQGITHVGFKLQEILDELVALTDWKRL